MTVHCTPPAFRVSRTASPPPLRPFRWRRAHWGARCAVRGARCAVCGVRCAAYDVARDVARVVPESSHTLSGC
eukprot:7097126-Prymnesium_polylepis.1